MKHRVSLTGTWELSLDKSLSLSFALVGVDLDMARKEEEQQMLQDARQWLNSGRIEDVKQPRTGATALHVAAAKGYSEVMR